MLPVKSQTPVTGLLMKGPQVQKYLDWFCFCVQNVRGVAVKAHEARRLDLKLVQTGKVPGKKLIYVYLYQLSIRSRAGEMNWSLASPSFD